MQSRVIQILCTKYNKALSEELVDCFYKAHKQFKCNNWHYFGNDIAHFIEISRRIVELSVFKSFTPLTKKLPNFNEKELLRIENSGNTDETYRILIPRILYSMACIRNKRGIVHKNEINPNIMDSTLLLNNAKWILAELVRKNSGLGFDETNELIESIQNREIDIIWQIEGKTRVLNPDINYTDKTLLLLYSNGEMTKTNLVNSLEHSNSTVYYKILRELHKKRLIEFSDPMCHISPLGERHVEEKILTKT